MDELATQDLSALDLSPLAGFTILFDLDGTLVESAPDLVQTLSFILQQNGAGEVSYDQARLWVGQGAKTMLSEALAAQGVTWAQEKLDRATEAFIDYYLEHISDHSYCFPGVKEILIPLRDAGIRMAVCTNKKGFLAEKLLRELHILPYFHAVVGADQVEHCKPDPGHFFAALTMAGGHARRCVFIGDSNTDFMTARAANTNFLFFTGGYEAAPPSALRERQLFDHFSQLPAKLLELTSTQMPHK